MACSCSPMQHSLPTPRTLYRDPGGRLRVLDAARTRALSVRQDLAPARRGSPPPCAPSRGTFTKPRPECQDQVAAAPEVADEASRARASEFQDCVSAARGAALKKVRFSDEVLADEDAMPPEAARGAGCTRVDAETTKAHNCAAHRDHDKQGVTRIGDTRAPGGGGVPSSAPGGGPGSGAPCECPCWAAYSAHPPASLATADIYRTCRLPKRFQYPAWFTAYDTGPKHPLYRTTSSDIGRHPPTVHTVPTIYRPVDRTLSKQYVPSGPWRNRSLCNTGSIWDIYTYNNFY